MMDADHLAGKVFALYSHVHTTRPRTDGSRDAAPIDPASERLQQEVFELVRARLLEAIGADGDFTVTVRRATEPAGPATLFDQTMADLIAWDVASRLVTPAVPNRAD